ncbi:MAG TPA: hypothetical protein VLH38_04705 [Patescibacteria group bacterium]|nr:hypothetical protein [Patescibacteria group bacterium]
MKNHAKRVLRITPKFVHGMVLGAFVGILVVMSLRSTTPAHATSVSGSRDCTANSVIECGALSTIELQQKYGQSGVADIFAAFGISGQDITNLTTTAVAGHVLKNGQVQVNGRTVATGAITAGRQNIPGSTRAIHGGVAFYERSPDVSFRSDSLSAFVAMRDGEFQFAILGTCGNPVMATPVPQAKATHLQPPTPQATTTPAPIVRQIPTATSSTVTQASVSQLPNTGPGAVLIIAVLSVIGGYIFHMTHRHVSRKLRKKTAPHHLSKR